MIRHLLETTPLIVVVLVLTLLVFGTAGLAIEVVRFLRDDWPMYVEYRNQGCGRAKAWRLARRT